MTSHMSHFVSSVTSVSNTVASTVANSVTSLLKKNDFASLDVLSQEKEILRIGNVLNSLWIHRSELSIPHLVTVGSQSSGKSTLLNAILGMDILPIGTNMVTRCPLRLEMIQTSADTKEAKAVFGSYESTSGQWTSIKEIALQFPNPSNDQRNEIASTINGITCQRAGSNMNISTEPIDLRIYGPNVPNLSVIDLPGIVSVACEDRGQSKDIKEQIRSMISTYISPASALILAVIPARTDIEVDIAMELIKQHDPDGERTLGILTKVDLMNEGTDVSHLLENRGISRSLQLQYGYFAIKNRNKIESETKSIQEGYQIESDYFAKHPVYSQSKYRDSVGTVALCRQLSQILVKSLKRSFPNLLEKIHQQVADTTKQLQALGTVIPADDTQRLSYIHNTIAELTRQFISILEGRGNRIDTGRRIKQIFIKYRSDLGQTQPFAKDNCPDDYLQTLIANSDGNHMPFSVSPIEIIEQLVSDKNRRPFQSIYEIQQVHMKSVLDELNDLFQKLVQDKMASQYPNFSKLLQTTAMNDVFLPNYQKTNAILEDEIRSQEGYVWTDDPLFYKLLKEQAQDIRSLAQAYYRYIIGIISDTVPKRIMHHFVHLSERGLSPALYEKVKSVQLGTLLQENEEVQHQRVELEKKLTALNSSKQLIESIL